MLRMRFGVRLRDWAERTSRFRVVQALIVMSLFTLVFELTQLPFDIHRHYVGLSYGLSVQRWGSWFGDWGKSLLLGLVFVTLLAGFSTERCAAVRVAGGSISGWL